MTAITEGIKNTPRVITFPQFPSITAYDDDGEEEVDVFIGDIAELYLRKFASTSGADKTFGLRDKDRKFYIGTKEAKIKEYNIIVGDRKYVGTSRLWELTVATTPDDKIFTNGDYDNYAEIMHSNKCLKEKQTMTKVKLNRKPTKAGNEAHIKSIWDEKDLCTGKGIM